MPTKYERQAPRIKLGTLPASLEANGDRSDGLVLDLSRAGAFLNDCSIGTSNATVVFYGPTETVSRNCSITRSSARWAAVSFDQPLSKREMSALVDGYAYEFSEAASDAVAAALRDEDQVNHEMRAIQACRSNLFLATLGALAASAVSIVGIIGRAGIALEASTVLLYGSLFALALFLVGVSATIEKARSTNLRKGFLRTLSRRIATRSLPAEYRGWSLLKTAISDCGDLRRLKCCPAGCKANGGRTCKDEGQRDAQSFHSVKRLFPGTLASFTTLSSTVYSCLFVLITCCVGWNLVRFVQQGYGLTPWQSGILFIVGILASPLLMLWIRPTLLIVCWFGVSLLIGAVYAGTFWGSVMSGVGGASLGLIGWFLLRQMNSCQRGKHSIETYTFTWNRVLDRCYPDVGTPRATSAPEETSWWRRKSGAWLGALMSGT